MARESNEHVGLYLGMLSVLAASRIVSAMLRLHSLASSPSYSLSCSSACTACCTTYGWGVTFLVYTLAWGSSRNVSLVWQSGLGLKLGKHLCVACGGLLIAEGSFIEDSQVNVIPTAVTLLFITATGSRRQHGVIHVCINRDTY